MLQGHPYGYTPFCTSREETLGFQFWRSGYWANHLQGRVRNNVMIGGAMRCDAQAHAGDPLLT